MTDPTPGQPPAPPDWPAYLPNPVAASPPAPPPPAPPPPPPPEPQPASASGETLQLALAEQQLEQAQQRLAEMDALLRDLPEIFERKFQQRLQPLLERHQHLLEDNQQLRQQLRQLTASDADMRPLPPARPRPATSEISEPSADSTETRPAVRPNKTRRRWSFLDRDTWQRAA